jgi:hypothetical protein
LRHFVVWQNSLLGARDQCNHLRVSLIDALSAPLLVVFVVVVVVVV